MFQNDGNIWVRTGNISNSIGIASPESAELLFGRKEKADLARLIYFKRAQEVYEAALKEADMDRKRKITEEHDEYKRKEASGALDLDAFAGGGGFKSRIFNMNLGTNVIMCTMAIQPFYPKGALIKPQDIKSQTQQIRDGAGNFPGFYFPDLNVRAIPEGVLRFDWGENDGALECHQLYSTGLVYLAIDVLRHNRETDTKQIYLSMIVNYLFQLFKVASNIYRLAGFQGGLKGSIDMKGAGGIPLVRTLHQNFRGWQNDHIPALLPDYHFELDTDTSVLSDDKKFQEYFINLVKEIYWAFGYPDLNDAEIIAFLKDHKWLIE